MPRNDKLLIISGSRDWTDEGPIRELLLWFDPYWTLVIHGKCRGADMIADRVAKELGFAVVAYPADWKRHNFGAGPIRNREMAVVGLTHQRYGIQVHAGIFPLPQSVGTIGMLELCRLGGFEIYLPASCKAYL